MVGEVGGWHCRGLRGVAITGDYGVGITGDCRVAITGDYGVGTVIVTVLVLVLVLMLVVGVVVVGVVVMVVVVVVLSVVVDRSVRLGGTTTLQDRDVVVVRVVIVVSGLGGVDVSSTINQMNSTMSNATSTPAPKIAAGLRYQGGGGSEGG